MNYLHLQLVNHHYDNYNTKYFDQTLPQLDMAVYSPFSGKLGNGSFKNGKVSLFLKEIIFTCNDLLEDTILHEMIHIYDNFNGRYSDPHGQHFIDKANEIANKLQYPIAELGISAERWPDRDYEMICPHLIRKI